MPRSVLDKFRPNYAKVGKFKSKEIYNCPICGSVPEVTDFVECTNPECMLWGHKFDLLDWNKRPYAKTVRHFTHTCVPIYKSGSWKRYNWFECNYCHAGAYKEKDIKHDADCEIAKFLKTYATSRLSVVRPQKR